MKNKFLVLLFMTMVMVAMCPVKAWAIDAPGLFTLLDGVTVELTKTGDYGWKVSDDGKSLVSDNYQVNNSSAEARLTFTSRTNMNLSFDYKVSSEDGYDFLFIKVDGMTVCDYFSGNKSNSYTRDEYQLVAGTHVVDLVYKKDVVGATGNDCGSIFNIKAEAMPLCGQHSHSSYSKRCDDCGYVEEHTHQFPESSDVEATCTEPSQSICQLCGELTADGKAEAFHPGSLSVKTQEDGKPVVSWDFDDGLAYLELACSHESHTVKSDAISLTKTTLKEPTCDEDGQENYKGTIEFNGQSYTCETTVVLSKKGHVFANNCISGICLE